MPRPGPEVQCRDANGLTPLELHKSDVLLIIEDGEENPSPGLDGPNGLTGDPFWKRLRQFEVHPCARLFLGRVSSNDRCALQLLEELAIYLAAAVAKRFGNGKQAANIEPYTIAPDSVTSSRTSS